MTVRKTAPVTFGGSGGIMSTARQEPYPCCCQAKSRDETSRRGGGGQ